MIPGSFHVRNVAIRPATVLAPMAGVTDTLFRRVIRGLGGCGLLMTEFTSSEGITRSARKTLRYLYFQEDERPITAQLFGRIPRSWRTRRGWSKTSGSTRWTSTSDAQPR